MFGTKPVVPAAPDYLAELQKTIKGDISLIPSVTDLASRSTALYKQLLEQSMPGYGKMLDLGTQQITAGLRGELPQDVRDQIARFDAEKAAGGGYSGSPGQANLTARDLGLTSLNLIQQNLGAADRWMQAAQGRTFDFSKMFYGPQEAMAQADASWNRDWLAAQVTAAPDPSKRGEYEANMAVAGMALGAYSGGPGYRGTSTGQNYQGGADGYQGNMGGGKDFQSYFDNPNESGWGYTMPNQGIDYNPGAGGAGAGAGEAWA